MVRIDVLPDLEHGWSVTRDRVVDVHFAKRDRAIVYGRTCAERARAAGLQVTLEIHEPLPEITPKQ